MSANQNQMQGIVVHEYGPPEDLNLESQPIPEPAAGQVRVRVEAAGVGFVDALMVQGLYQIKPPTPWAPGMEFAGTVDACGADVTDLRVGDAVCGTAGAALSDYLVASAQSCTPIPAGLSMAEAAGFWTNHATALLGFWDCGNLQPGETVLILGAAGGVGSAAISVAKAMGAHVIAAASTDEKLAYCTAAGADETINYADPEWRNELKARYPKGIDLAYDPVGGDFTELALRSMAPGGRLLIVGFANGAIPAPRLNLALLKRCSIVGVNWGGEIAANPEVEQRIKGRLVEMVADGMRPAPVTTWPLAEAPGALRAMLDRQATGKVVLLPELGSNGETE